MDYQFYTADVFTNRLFGGNQLVVFPDARGLDTQQMQQIAREFNVSETVFVFPPRQPTHTRHLRIFTPQMELPFAGHPTIGTAHVLAAIGAVPLTAAETHIVFEEGVGPVPVAIRTQDGQPVFAQFTAAARPEAGPPPPPPEVIAHVLSIDVADVVTGTYKPWAVSCGVPFLIVPVQDRTALGRVRLDRTIWEQVLASFWAPHVYVFTLDAELPGSTVRARMFAPAMGIAEDPATGAAATALAGYLVAQQKPAMGTRRWIIEQGFEMGRPSILEVEADIVDEGIAAIRVGGATVSVSEGVFYGSHIPSQA